MLRQNFVQRLAQYPLRRAVGVRGYKAAVFQPSSSIMLPKSIYTARWTTANLKYARLASSEVRGYARSRYEEFKQWQNEQRSQQRSHEQPPSEPEWEYRPEGPSGGRVLLLRPTLWALAFTAGTFYVCSNVFIGHQEKLLKKSRNLLDMFWAAPDGGSESDRVWNIMGDPRVQHLVGMYHNVHSEEHARMIRRIARLPEWVPHEVKRTVVALTDRWYKLSRGSRCVYTIAGLNVLVFGMWQMPRLVPFMARRFLHDPRSGLSYTMLTSTFSHKDLWHLLFNSIALVSFGTSVANTMGAEHFTAFYLSAGVLSSLASHVLAPLRPALILPSLGASGAVYGVVGAMMMLFPHAQIAIIFLPFIPMSISHVFPALLAYDFAGAVLGWRTFGHVAHLAGGLYGLAYLEWGTEYWNRLVRFIDRHRRKN
ncbi:hypothetical protein IW148_005708 [Coemansia sp. RSA 1199]|nr:hypothetical protein IW148_005708 [Coemansia sp. RSA 1199]